MGLSRLPGENESHAAKPGTRADPRLLLARRLGVLLALFLLAFFMLNLPAYWTQLQMVCIQSNCPPWQLSATQARALQHAGLALPLYAIVSLTLDLFCTLIWFAVSACIAWRGPRNWMTLLVSLFLITQAIAQFTGSLAFPLHYLSSRWDIPILFLFLLDSLLYLLVFSLFPNGRFVPGWMPWFVCGQVVMGAIALCLSMFFLRTASLFIPLTVPLFLSSWTIILGAQIYRYRRVSSPTERQQTRWVVFGLIGGPIMGVLFFFPPLVFPALGGPASLSSLLFPPAFTIISIFTPLCFSIAILRYHLWNIDGLISRALVYSILTASVFILSVSIVVGLGSLLQAQGNIFLSLLATGVIAVLFQPLRQRVQEVVNRLLYGERDAPHRVLARLGHHLEATLTPDAVLSLIVETVAQALKLPFAAITWTPQDVRGEPTILAAYGTADEQTGREFVPLMYQQEKIGEMILSPRKPGESLTPADQHFLRELAPQIGVAVHAIRLADDLKQLTLDLQRSREQLVTAREEERRRLRRDLHDGLGPQLSSQPLLLTSALMLLRQNPDEAEAILKDAIIQSQQAVSDIRRVVYALRPPTLDELGLVPAIGELLVQHRASGILFSLETPEQVPPLSAAVEVACYRIVQEALTNVVRHAHAHTCLVRLRCQEQVKVEIIDDGQGFPPVYRRGVGLTSMGERAEELGGRWLIKPGPDGGTHVLAQIPYR